MVAFTHSDGGTRETAWLRAGAGNLPDLPMNDAELAGLTFLVVAAHPDDETLGAGGLLHKLATLGADTRVLLCTAGEASHPHSPTKTPRSLKSIRLKEFHDGLATAGLTGHSTFLGLPDGQLAAHRSQIRSALLRALKDLHREAGDVVLVAPLRTDGHTDHEVLGELAAEVASARGHGLLEYPIWYWHWAMATDSRWHGWVRLSLKPDEHATKSQALLAHRSQVTPLSARPGDGVLLSENVLEHFRRPWETFAWTRPAAGTYTSADAERIFDEVHRTSRDHWSSDASWYEQRKRNLTVATLPESEYASALEVGCSTGSLGKELATRCRKLLCVDASSEAISAAENRLGDLPWVRIAQMTVPKEWPEGHFDLIVLSEIGYYLAPGELQSVLAKVEQSLAPGGTLVLCHWRHPITGWALDGDSVHAQARTQLPWPSTALYREKDFVLEAFTADRSSAGGQE
jgi:LmbE family N-acetylglucosaminyl deacetylase